MLAALAQTYQDYEIVVSDNASTDGTQAVLAEFDDHRLRVIREDRNLGLRSTLTVTGADNAGGPEGTKG